MSLLARLIIAAGCAAQLASLRAAEAGSPLPAAQDITLRAFQDDDYRLAFDVMVSTGRLKEALHIARQAVQDQPRSRVWRVRLAQVAEWLGYPSWAAEQWRVLFNMGDRSEETVTGVLRLAPAMSDPEVAIRAWAYRAERAPLTDVQWQEIYWLYESSAEPSQGRRFFEIQYRAKRQPLLLDLAARLATNAGEDDRALALYVERVPLEPFSMEAVLQAVFGYIRRDQWNEAQELLQAQTRRVSADASEFWRLLAQVAWERRDFLTAEQAYRRIATLPQGEASDWARLIFLARQRDAHAAVALANEAYRRFGTADHLQQVLEMYGELGDTAGQANVYRSLSPQQLERAEQHVPFLFGRAQFFMRQGKSEAGWQDLLRVRKLAPQDDNLVQALLWFMINERRQSELAQALQQYRARATSDPEFWPTYAAGYQLLGQHQEALSWHLKSLDRRSDDPLLLLNYADTLTQLGRTGMANRVRLHAWRLLQTYRPHQPEDLRALGRQPEMQAWARQALLDQSGDPGQQLVKQLALLLRAGPVDAATQEQIDNLLLGWTALKEQPALARSWLLRSYLRQSREVPAATDAMVALQQGDATRMDALLNRGKHSRLSPEIRYEMAQALGQTPLALQTAQQGMEQSSTADVMHERLRLQFPPNANYLQLRAFNEGLDVLERKGLQFEGRWVANPGLHVLAGGSRVGQSSSDPNFATLAPDSDQLDLLEFRMFGVDHESRINLQQRAALERIQSLRLYRSGQLLARLNYEIGLNYRSESILSLPLRVAGYENSLYASFSYSLDKRNYLRIAPHMSRYYTQYHDELGSGRILELEVGHRLQTEFPAWRARVYALGQDFSANGSISAENLTRLPAYLQTGIGNGIISAAEYFVPQSNTTVGGCVSMGDTAAGPGQRGGYRRAWRPFMDLCLRHNTVAGDGYTGLLGVAGSLIGTDEMAMQWQSSDGAVPGSATTHSLSIRYRHYF